MLIFSDKGTKRDIEVEEVPSNVAIYNPLTASSLYSYIRDAIVRHEDLEQLII